jgi:hypothetical protein
MGNSLVEQLSCPKCNHTFLPKGKALTVALTCTKCGVYFCVHTKANDQFLNKSAPYIPIGTRGIIHGTVYEVMGFVVKREQKYRYTWGEYFLFNPNVGIAFLSENDGNWNFLKPYSKHPLLVTHTTEPTIKEGKFRLYAKYKAEVLFASGEFFTDVIESTESSLHYEHINPPYVLTYEEGKSQLGGFLGQYISGKEVAAAFGINEKKMPPKNGMGYTEPHSFSIDESLLVSITILTVIAAFLLQLILNETSINKKVFQGSFNQSDLTEQKMFTTTSFDLPGSEKNVVVTVSAPISNDWFFAEYSLINEATDQEYIFTKEIEYYHGKEGGESWSEGSNKGEAFLSSIPGGKYHINIYPEFSLNNHKFDLSVVRDAPFYSNFGILFFLLCLFPACFYGYKYYKEVTRWKDSDYSPYDYE